MRAERVLQATLTHQKVFVPDLLSYAFLFIYLFIFISFYYFIFVSSQCLQEYQWAIGTTPGGQDIQNYTSTGLYPTGKNDQLYGVITHNVRYYASYKCVNGGGLVTTFEDPTGGKHYSAGRYTA